MKATKRDFAATHGRRWGVARTGLTTLEFVGCTMAVVGGAWLGAVYLGVDLRHVAYTALAEAQLLDNVPTKWRPAPPENNATNREELVATLRDEMRALRSELTSLRTGVAEGSEPQTAKLRPAPQSVPSGSVSSKVSKEQTLAYWQRLSDIALHEAELQQDAELASNEQNAAKVFAIKARIGRFAANSVEAVASEGVDDSVIQFGQQLAVWYGHGGELYERAVGIWETPVDSQRREQLNHEWRRADLHHRNEARLINEKAVAVRSAVSRQFGAEFPEFGKPGALTSDPESNPQP